MGLWRRRSLSLPAAVTTMVVATVVMTTVMSAMPGNLTSNDVMGRGFDLGFSVTSEACASDQ